MFRNVVVSRIVRGGKLCQVKGSSPPSSWVLGISYPLTRDYTWGRPQGGSVVDHTTLLSHDIWGFPWDGYLLGAYICHSESLEQIYS